MAYNKDQNELPLPSNGSERRKSEQHLPRYFRTDVNKKFLASTLDQLIQPGVAEKLNGYIGRKNSKGYSNSDFYVGDVSADRENYQLEPAAVIKDELGNVNFYGDYIDYINQIANLDSQITDHSLINRQEYYAWDPHIDWDKFTNFREYYWLPNGPQPVPVAGISSNVQSTFTVTSVDNIDNFAYVFNPDGLTQNPELVLYRGITYRFEINTPGLPLSFRSQRDNAPNWIPETYYTVGERVFFNNKIYIAKEDFRASTEFENDESKWDLDVTFNLEREVSDNGVDQGVIELTLDAGSPDYIYYVSDNDVNAGGLIRVYNIEEAQFLDVEKEIVGKKNYTTNDNFELSNGMKVYFQGNTTPEKYSSGNWYVEGVGESIRLVSEEELNVPSAFTTDLEVAFDDQGFDTLPYSEAIGYPVNKDYITINRSSQDGNLWSKYNRWFHREVIEKSAEINGQTATIDQSSRATRPIIEFEPNLKLFDFGTSVKANIDLVDDFTKDVFSNIEGSTGYNIDGVDLTNGMRVLFTADPDPLVSGKIYEVKFIVFENNRQITLQEIEDSNPITNENVLCKQGQTYKGKMLFFDGLQWKLAQDKTTTNQPPLFDLFDCDDYSLGDPDYYESTTFVGTKLFSYKQGSGTPDSELGFPLSYRSIENVGDITFEFNLLSDGFSFCTSGETPTETTAGIGYLRKYSDIDNFDYLNGWKKSDTLSNQNVIRQYVVDNTRTSYPIDVYDNSGSIEDLWIRILVNNKLLFENTDYTFSIDAQNRLVVNFVNNLSIGDVIVIKTRSSQPKNENGYYEIASNLERNPLNKNIKEFTLGEVNDHVGTIVEEMNNFAGSFPGSSNLRDIGDITKYGKRIVKHSAPLNLALYHLLDKDANLTKSLKFARREYGKFKRTFLQKAFEIGFDGPVKDHVDVILNEIVKDKTKTMPFYFSDMVPLGASVRTDFEVDDVDLQFFALNRVFDLSSPSDKAVQVYKNGVQLIHNVDYTFNADGFVIVPGQKQIGDLFTIYEYENTNGCYCPPTPTKLGLYPKYLPTKFIDDTYLQPQEVIQGHDGSITIAFGDFRDDLLLELEKRIYNNLKVEYDTTLFDIHDYIPSEHRDTGLTQQQIDYTMLSDFVQWLQLVDSDYTANTDYLRENPFTFNHQGMTDPSGNTVSGWWRAVYKHAYDTDRPHTRPWEMLGFTIKPNWWDEQYGEAPYTSNNLLLWEDLENGVIREPGKNFVIDKKYVRPGLTQHLPVDEQGNLVSPVYSGYIKDYITTELDFNFIYGDHSPVENAWRRSSEYPFALLNSLFVNQPNNVLSTAWDRIRQKRGRVDDIIYDKPNTQIKLEDIVFPNTINDETRVYTSGMVNYIFDYLASNVSVTYQEYKNNILSIDNQIGFKLAGYTSKDKFKLILDSRTPLNEGNVFVPEENYKVFLNKSSPVTTIPYSGVIIEKQTFGFVIRGYNTQQPFFKYLKPFELDNDPLINIGGVSQTFIQWDSRKSYTKGNIVEFENNYYRVTEPHTSGTDFDATKFAKIPELPTVGGRDAFFRKRFTSVAETVPYGTVFTTIQEVVDFLLGYGAYLESLGFVFDYYDEENAFVADWQTSAKEFMFWTTQNWGAGAVITLSPAAFQLKFISANSVVDDIYDTFYGYSLFKADGKKLEPEYARLTRENPNEFIVRPKNTADGIFGIRLSLVQKEHAVLIDNRTVFNDIIFDQEPGYRQERIKVLGYRTADWDGSLNIPGFVFDNAKVTEWQPWTDYAIGDLVRYKEFFYTARNKIAGKNVFDANEWVRLSDEPEAGLLPNFEYKTNQFADFYDLDTDNFDIEQQKFAQHLIGYQNRRYLANIINDDVSQYKFYQGMIQDKGTKNALSKLFDVLSSADKDSLEFYEEWAIKAGQYGAADSFEEVEFKLDESKMRLSPQSFELVNSITGQETDLVYRIRPFEVYLQPQDYNNRPFPEKYVFDTYTKNSGYVNPEDVEFIVSTYDSILNINYATVNDGDKIWVGNDKLSWNVYTNVRTDFKITQYQSAPGGATLTLDTTNVDLTVGEIIGIYDIQGIEQFVTVSKIDGDKLTVLSDNLVEPSETDNLDGRITKLIDTRVDSLVNANQMLQSTDEQIDRVWIDQDSSGQWLVIDQNDAYQSSQVLSKTDSIENANYGVALSANRSNNVLAVGAPDSEDGKVYIYTRGGSANPWKLTQIIEADESLADSSQRFGASVELTDDGRYLAIGSPNASNVRTNFKGNYAEQTDYDAQDIVSYEGSLWRAAVDISGAVDNILFGSFDSVAQIRVALGLTQSDSENVPALLAGNFPFTNVTTDHLIVRAPLDMYEGSGIGDTLKLKWNDVSFAYQTQDVLSPIEPFAGDIPGIDTALITGSHTIAEKIDSILYVDASTTVPLVGQTVEVVGGFGTVAYTYNEDAQLVIYIKDQNGTFGPSGSLTTSIGEFVGEYETVAPTDTTANFDNFWGGYWKIDVGSINIDQINSDTGRGLVYTDIVPSGTVDPNRFYFNMLDYQPEPVVDTNPANSNDVINSQVTTLTYDGQPGPNGVTGLQPSSLFVLRGTKDLTDNLNITAPGDNANDTVDIFYNSLPRFEDADWTPNTEFESGTILRFPTAEYNNIYWRVRTDHVSRDQFLIDDPNSNDPLDLIFDELFYEPLDDLEFKDPATIGLSLGDINKTHTVYDVWDGYIDAVITKNLGGVAIEPKEGIIVRDVTNGGTALVTFYQKFDTENIRMYVKNVSGTWAAGNDFGENREIEFLADGSGDPLYDPAAGSRIFGQIQSRSLGLPSENIGGLVVLDRGANVQLQDSDTIIDAEYWFYREGSVAGIPRAANIPEETNNDWTEVFNIPVDATGTASGLSNEGFYSVYEKAGSSSFAKLGSFTVEERTNNNHLGFSLKFGRKEQLYKLFVKSEGDGTESNPGKIYIINNGVGEDYIFGWEFSRDKRFKGEFSQLNNYFENNIVLFDGNLYQANTNLAPGQFDISDWTIIEDSKDILGYIPNDQGFILGNDQSTILDQDLMTAFATDFDVSANAEVLVASVEYADSKQNVIAVYRNDGGFYKRYQQIAAPSKITEYGSSISISDDGRIIAVGEPFNDEIATDAGKVYIYTQVNGEFVLTQELFSPIGEKAELFGLEVDFDGNTLAVSSRNADSYVETILDSGSTLLDGDFTKLRDYNIDAGVVRVYERINDSLIYGQTIDFDDSGVRAFGRNIKVSGNEIYVGMPLLKFSGAEEGTVVNFKKTQNIWSILRQAKTTVDVNKIKRVVLYDTNTNELLQYLDYIDVLQGKIAGIAEQELSYKTYYDPATYTNGTGVNIDPTNSWDDKQVGKLWWDLTNAKFNNPYQDSVIFSANNWNTTFSASNTIDVYEWVESTLLPSEWDNQSNTERGISRGISGKSLYGDNAYVQKRVYDSASKTFTNMYYYWVGNKTTLPAIENRTISAQDVANLIENPAREGYRFISFISPGQFALHNVERLIKGRDIALSIQYYTVDDQDINLHNQYQILSEGLETSRPSRDVEQKWFDSLVGFDLANRSVPAPELSAKEKYGSLNRPRQSWFVNRTQALKEFIARTNTVLARNLIIDDKDISRLLESEPKPLITSGRYDRSVDSEVDLQFVGVARARQAVLTPVIQDGKIVRVDITDSGRGYLIAPTVEVNGAGENAVIKTVINSVGSIIDVIVENQGQYYDSANTSLSVRRYTVLVNSDTTLAGRWSLYERDTVASEWIRVASQGYDVSRYWSYIDWYADGFNQFTDIDYVIDFSFQLQGLQDDIGDIVKIRNVGSGGWLLLEKVDSQIGVDYTVNYNTIGRENGTIKFDDSLFDIEKNLAGYDTTTFDSLVFDGQPSRELRIILETIRDELFVDDLAIEYNNLFFASIRYVFSEQNYVDWAFKTSFIKAQHNVGELEQKINFQNDNLPSYEEYIKEVKPFKTKIREYLSSYEKLDNSQSMTTDFDLPPAYLEATDTIRAKDIKVIDNSIIANQSDISTYPNRHWADNVGYKVLNIEVSDPGQGYVTAPVITVTGGGGSGATAKASVGRNGTITSIEVINSGTGYLSAPDIRIDGTVSDGGKEASAVAIIGDSPVRSMRTVVKFDRVSGEFEFINLDTVETFVAAGSRFVFDLKWPMDLRTTRISVFVNGDEVLGGNYSYQNILDTSKGYDRYIGQINFADAPAEGSEVRIVYNKDAALLKAQDRVNLLYEPIADQLGNTLGQLMKGVDYGGVEVRSFDFGGLSGWDSQPWMAQGWDIYDTTFEDEIIRLDGSTVSIELSKPLEEGVTYNLYRISYDSSGQIVSNLRMDDPDYDGSTMIDKPHVVMNPIVGDGVTTTIFLDELGVPTIPEDSTEAEISIIVRKITSDGAFLPDPDSYDTALSGGDLAYQSATGLKAEEINIDGDGFVTTTTSAGPEEVVPGQVMDTLDITVYQKSTGGASEFVVRNYTGDGVTNQFDIGDTPISRDNFFVKLDDSIVKDKNLYYIDFNTNKVVLDNAPAIGTQIMLVSIGFSAPNIIDIDSFVGDGQTIEFLTNARFEENAEAFVTVNGRKIEVVLEESDDSYEYPGNFVLRFPEPPFDGAIIRCLIGEQGSNDYEYSQVTIDTIIADGSSTSYELGQAPFAQTPARAYMLVQVNDTVLHSGYSEKFEVTNVREYQLDLTQVPIATTNASEIEVYLNGRKLEFLQEWTYEGAGSFNSNLTPAQQAGSTVILERGIGDPGDELLVYVVTDAEYKMGFYDSNDNFVETPGTIHFDSAYSEGDVITVYQFSNHDSQDIQRQVYDIIERTELTVGTDDYYEFRNIQKGLIELRKPAVDAQYIWLSQNGTLLTPSVDYSVTPDRRYVKMLVPPAEGDTIQVIHFAGGKVVERLGWRQFKDLLNRTHYKRLEEMYELAEDLKFSDKSIKVVDATGLPAPEYNAKYPGVIFIEGERIEYFNKDGNELKQIRRGTLGTGVKDLYTAGTFFMEQGVDASLPYKDENEVVTVQAGGYTIGSTIYENSPGVTVSEIYYTSNNNSAFPLGGDPIPSIGFPGQEAVVKGTGFKSNVKAIVGETECVTTFVSSTELRFKTPALPVGSYDLIIINPATNVPIDQPQTSVVVPGGIPYLQILLPYAPIPNPTSATNWYKETRTISVADMIPGRGYEIVTPGTTDFTQIGSPNNNSGTEFILPRDVDTALLTGTGTVNDYTSIPYEYWEAQDIEVFVAGRRLRKTPIAVYNYDAQDSPEGDITVEAEFAVNKNVGAYVRLTEPPAEGSQVTIVKKIGALWQDAGETLSQADTDVARFLQNKTTDQPR